jgi:hypothetical protein
MRLICYPAAANPPTIRPARAERGWMDGGDKFAYRCLPLAIGNAHGWEILTPYTIEAEWNGGAGPADLVVWSVGHLESGRIFSHFGLGVLTFDVGYVFRTEAEMNLWVSGPTNDPKHGIAALSGIVETDWMPYSFSMNWRFTRPGRVRFEKGEPFCFFFPVGRGVVDTAEPEIRAMSSDPELAETYAHWRDSRMNFMQDMHQAGTRASAERWQKNYFRGQLPDGRPGAVAHQTKIRAKPFVDKSGG